MKKYIIYILCLFSFSILSAGESVSWKSWYENLLKSLKYKIEKKLNPTSKVTAVAAVRGAKQSDKSQELYWKGSNSKKAQEKIDAERKILREAVEKIVAGDIEKGRAQLNDFIAKNPNSYFIGEAKEALNKLPKPEIKDLENKPLENTPEKEIKSENVKTPEAEPQKESKKK